VNNKLGRLWQKTTHVSLYFIIRLTNEEESENPYSKSFF